MTTSLSELMMTSAEELTDEKVEEIVKILREQRKNFAEKAAEEKAPKTKESKEKAPRKKKEKISLDNLLDE